MFTISTQAMRKGVDMRTRCASSWMVRLRSVSRPGRRRARPVTAAMAKTRTNLTALTALLAVMYGRISSSHSAGRTFSLTVRCRLCAISAKFSGSSAVLFREEEFVAEEASMSGNLPQCGHLSVEDLSP